MSISSERKHANLSQAELASMLGLKQAAVSNWERGRNSPTASALMQMSKIFGCTIDKLLLSEVEAHEP